MMMPPLRYLPHSLVGFVQCKAGHPLKALYVLFRPKGAEGLPEELVAEITSPFALAWTGPYGDLHLVDPEQDGRIHLGYREPMALPPHAVKLMHERHYDCYFVRHPDLNWVREAQAELNGLRPILLTQGWKPVEAQPRMAVVAAPEVISALALQVDESPESYYPKGPERYGNWLLYKDMPNDECPTVKQAVVKLQEELGSLRYMVGSENPYMPEQFSEKNKNYETANEGVFDGRTINAVFLFQQNVQTGDGWQVDPARTIAKAGRKETEETSLAYLVGAPYTGGRRDVAADGVVDQRTADAIEARLKDGVCSPKKIMVCLPAREGGSLYWNVWMRPEAAAALYSWRELARALGFPQTVAANHTFRSAAVNVGSAGFGRSWKSIHKIGLAVDVGLDKTYFNAAEDWPVFYQRDLVVNKKDKIGDAVRIYWRVFGISNHNIPDQAAIDECRKGLEQILKNTHPLGGVARKTAAKLIKEIDDKIFAAKYFRPKIRQWAYDPWDGDGGKEGPEIGAGEARKKQLAEAEALFAANDLRRLETPKGNRRTLAAIDKSEEKQRALYKNWTKTASRFLDLTALAKESGLERIGSFSNHVDPKNASEWGLGVVTYSTAKFKKLADGVAKLRATHPELQIEIGAEAVTLSRVDAEFMTAFGEGRVECAVSQDKAGEKRVAKFCERLRQFGARKFRRMPDDVAQTGEEWAAAVEAKLVEIKTAAPVNKTDSSQGSTKKRDASEWTYRLEPDYAVTGAGIYFPPKTAVQLPSPGAPIGLEWWHFQVDEVINKGDFGPLICELGWTEETLFDIPLPVLHYRFGMGYPQEAWTVPAG